MLNADPPWTPSSRRMWLGVGQSSSAAGPAWTTRPASSTTTSRASRCTTGRFCSTRRIGRQLGRALERGSDLGHEQRREALRRLVDEEHLVSVEEGARDRDHLLLPAGERAGSLGGALAELGEQVVDEVVARVGVALGEPEVLLDGEPREDVAILGDVADAAAHDRMRREGA